MRIDSSKPGALRRTHSEAGSGDVVEVAPHATHNTARTGAQMLFEIPGLACFSVSLTT